MLKFSKLVREMDASDHSKNRASLKSKISKSPPLRNFVMLIVCALSFTTIGAQTIGTVKDYFYPKPERIIYKFANDKNNSFEMIYKFDGFDNSGAGQLTFASFFEGKNSAGSIEKVKITGNGIVSTEKRSYNPFSGETTSREQTSLLRLPDKGKTVTWAPETGVTHTATLVNLQIEIDNEKKTVLAIKVVQKFDDGKDIGIEYWGKERGLVFQVTNTGTVVKYNASIGLTSLSYRELSIN